MTAIRLPRSAPVRDRAPIDVRRVAVGAALVVIAVGLAWVGNSIIAVAIIAAVAALVITFGLIIKQPEVLLPIAVISMWIEGLGGQASIGRVMSVVIPLVIVARIATTSWRPAALQPRAWVPLLVLTVWCWLGVFWAKVPVGGWLIGFFTLFLGIAYALAFMVFTESPAQVMKLMTIWVWLGALVALASSFVFFVGGVRGYGFTGGANNYAAFVVAGFPVIVVLARAAEGRARLLLWCNVPIYLSALIASGSRMGFIMGGVMGVYIFSTMPGIRGRKRVITIVGGAVFMGVVVFLFAALNSDRFSLAAFFSDRGAGRLDIWPAAIAAFKLHPLQGWGLGGFRSSSYELVQQTSGASLQALRQTDDIRVGYIEAHNLYLSILMDLGLIGTTIYFGLIASTMKNLWDLRKTAWGQLVWAFQGVQIALLIGQFFGTQLNQKFQWMIIGLAAGIYRKQRMIHRSSLPGSV